jgi:hypothetical protein
MLIIAVSTVAVTDMEDAGDAVEPCSREPGIRQPGYAVAVVAAVAASGGEMDDVGAAAVRG